MAPATDEVEASTGHAETEHRSSPTGFIGQLVGDTYRITRHIGSGGSSHVFAAEHVRLGKDFAIKLLRASFDPAGRAAQRFRREAKAIARLASEHIVGVVDCGELPDGTPYLVMELLEGEDLRSLLNREGALPARRAVQLVVEACRGLTVVHQAGLVHRDLKPENLFITRRATGEDWCKVLDFGVAKMDASLSTAEGAIVGTVRYMAPEQLATGASVGPATDVYALGAILYECLSAKPVQSGDTMQQVMFGVMNSKPEQLAELCPTLRGALCEVVMSCLAKEAARRPRLAELEQRLLAAVNHQPRVGSDETSSDEQSLPRPPIPSPTRSSWSKRTVAIAACTAFGGAAVAWLAKPAGMPIAPDPATTLAISTIAPPPREAQIAALSAPSPTQARPAPSAADAASREPIRRKVNPARMPSQPSAQAVTATAAAPFGRFDHVNPYAE